MRELRQRKRDEEEIKGGVDQGNGRARPLKEIRKETFIERAGCFWEAQGSHGMVIRPSRNRNGRFGWYEDPAP